MNKSILHYWLIEPRVVSQKSKAKYLRYILRYLMCWKYNYAWVKYLNSSSQIKHWKEMYGCDLYLKMQQPYLSGHLNPQQKYEYLTQHYNWLFQNFNIEELNSYELLLWSSTVDLDDKCCKIGIFLNLKAPFVTEGECALVLKLNDDIQYTLSFTYIIQDNKPMFFIGGLQGGKQDVTNSALLKKMTKSMYGLRPKHFMVHAISTFADYFQVQNLICVSNRNHTFQSSRRKSKRARVKANLDEFWLDFSETKTDEGNYIVEPISHEIDLEIIQSKKRSQYRKRQIILNDFVEQSNDRLTKLAKNSHTSILS
jgi:uncharacterized protein